MKIIKAYYEIIDDFNGADVLKKLERCGRVCYKSEEKISDGSAERFINAIVKRGHGSVLEHFSFSVRFVTDRGVTHEIVRHRIASFSQESTRYCNYGDYNDGCSFIEPCFWERDSENYAAWTVACQACENIYLKMLEKGATPQQARTVLPNSLKTELIMTCNLREWRHFFELRTDKAAHPQMRELTVPLLSELKTRIPVIFDDINY